jgi:hypothetical protein
VFRRVVGIVFDVVDALLEGRGHDAYMNALEVLSIVDLVRFVVLFFLLWLGFCPLLSELDF